MFKIAVEATKKMTHGSGNNDEDEELDDEREERFLFS